MQQNTRYARLFARLLPVIILLPVLAACGSGVGTDEDTKANKTPSALSPDSAAPQTTPLPETAPELLALGLDRRAIGDDEGAAFFLSALLQHYPDAAEARPAYYYLAESFALRGRWTSAITAFRDISSQDGDDEYTHRALFWLARGYEESGDWNSAIETFERYRAFDTPLEPYAAARQAALYDVLGQHAEAAQRYEAVATSDIQPGEQAGSHEKAIALRRQMGQNAEALQLYEELLQLASLPEYRARILFEAAGLAEAQGRTDQAHAWLHEIVTDTPQAAEAVGAVEKLLTAGGPLLRAAEAAEVYFYAERYDDALPLFDAAVAQAPPNSAEQLDLQLQRALTRRALGDFEGAMQEQALVANASPGSDQDRQARLDWIQTLGQSGEPAVAAERYSAYAQDFADDWRAPVALDRAAQLRERVGQYDQAIQIWRELGQRYPQDELAPPALRTVAWHFYGNGQLDQAADAWRLLTASSNNYEQARGAFWAARLARSHQQNQEEASALFEMAHDAAPNSYYGYRAAEELGISLTGSVPLGASLTDEDWQTSADWVLEWAQTDATDAQAVLADVERSGFVQRAVELHEVGLHIEAIGEWNSARDAWASEPLRLAALAWQAHHHNMPYIGLKASEQLVVLAPSEALPPPEPIERLMFPAPYSELVVQETRAHDVDPRLFYALLRQESLFNPGATSWVGARGLAQVMPSTGQGIAQNLGVADFQLDDLYRPQVSIEFGAFYLGQRLQDMEGSPHGALAAYNGGLGNAQRWASGSHVADADLFTEYIDYPETETYVKRVYGYYGVYQRLYTLPEESS